MGNGVSIGPRIQVDGEEKYRQQLKNIIEQSKTLDAEMKALTATFGEEDSVQQQAAKSSELLNRQLEVTRERTRLVSEMTQKSIEQTGENSIQTLKWRQARAASEEQEAKLLRAVEENTKALAEQNDVIDQSGMKMTGLGDTIDTVADKLGIHLPDSAKEALNGIEGFSAGSVAKLGAVAAATAMVIGAMKELHEMTIEAAEQADALLTRAAQTGLDVELIQALDNASKYIDFDGIDQSLAKLTQTMGKARDGAAEQSEAFNSLGVTIRNEDGSLRDNYSTFLDVIDALRDVENETERDVLANDLFGKSYKDIKPLIDAGSESLKQFTNEAKENGLVLTNEQVKKLGEVDDAHQKLQATVDVTQKKIAADYAPAVIAAMDLITEAVTAAGDAFIESGLIANTAELIEKGATLLKTGTDLAQRIPDWMNPVKVASKDIELLNRTIEGTLDLLGLANKEMIGYGTVGSDVYGASWKSDVQAWVTAGGTIITPDIIDQIDKTTGKPKNSFYLGNLVPGDSVYSYGHMDEDEIQRLLAKIGRNATGTPNWKGGLTWVGEQGPELVQLPRNTQIFDNETSEQIAAEAAKRQPIQKDYSRDINDILHAVKDLTAATAAIPSMLRIKGRMSGGT